MSKPVDFDASDFQSKKPEVRAIDMKPEFFAEREREQAEARRNGKKAAISQSGE